MNSWSCRKMTTSCKCATHVLLMFAKEEKKVVILEQKGTWMAEDGEDWSGMEMMIMKSLANFFKIHEWWCSSFNQWMNEWISQSVSQLVHFLFHLSVWQIMVLKWKYEIVKNMTNKICCHTYEILNVCKSLKLGTVIGWQLVFGTYGIYTTRSDSSPAISHSPKGARVD